MEIAEAKDIWAEVADENKAPLAGKRVTFALVKANGVLVKELGAAVTEKTGRATLRTGVWDVLPGTYVLRAKFAGDAELLPEVDPIVGPRGSTARSW